ncbi:hypothetical protein [Chryseobacterium sp. HSC-36S06]|uniref:phage integrase SAM-like domain-containing protein n=1 Tax=Chryseobacterium sp. HSC-36S06 TaxID=2910970 RepID=UPI00209D8885|nr:hypothetical protein [Chryseobacterium sp. HSC-36S06]MCP2036931.1 integrase [Chryseobacterium sp. HSC-36S06]
MVKLFIRKNHSKKRISLRYCEGRKLDIVLATPFTIDPKNWDASNECYDVSIRKKYPKNDLERAQNNLIDEFNLKIEEFKINLQRFLLHNDKVTSKSLQHFINPLKSEKEKIQIKKIIKTRIPLLMKDFIEYYIAERDNQSHLHMKELSLGSVKAYRKIKEKIAAINPSLKVTDINDDFRKTYTIWGKENNYSDHYIVKNLKYIKTFVEYGKQKGLPVSQDVANWSFINIKKDYYDPTLNEDELNIIENYEFDDPQLTVARDWLILGCHCGQRVSDLLQFTESKVTDEDFIEFTQKKGDKKIAIYMFPEVKKIREKYNGFPPSMTDQRFNLQIKIVAKKCGLTEKIIGGKMIDKRKVVGEYEKWELITSHICRRSFVTNYRYKLGDDTMLYITGHTSIKMLDQYDMRTPLIKAKQVKAVVDEKLKNI